MISVMLAETYPTALECAIDVNEAPAYKCSGYIDLQHALILLAADELFT
jgi:hypothetical protein